MDTIQKELKWKSLGEAKTETVYFRELTGGETLALTKGQTYKGNAKDGVVEIDVHASAEAGQKLVVVSLVDASGNQVYAGLKQLQAESGKKVAALVELAREVHSEKDEDEPGNG